MRDNGDASQGSAQNAQDSQGEATPPGPGTEGLKSIGHPYYPAFDLLLARLLAHEEILDLVPSRILFEPDGATESTVVRREVDLTADGIPGMVADICEMRQDHFVRHFPTFRLPDATNEARSHVKEAFRRRCCSWILVHSFESFREFAEEIDQAISEKRQGEECPGGGAASEQVFSHTRGRPDLKDVRRRIRNAAPALGKCEECNSRHVNLGSWIHVLSAVRHAIVHNDGIIPAQRWRKLRCGGPKMRFPGREIGDGGYLLDVTPEAARDAIVRLREYGFAIYKALSAAAGCHAMLYDPAKGMTVWRR